MLGLRRRNVRMAGAADLGTDAGLGPLERTPGRLVRQGCRLRQTGLISATPDRYRQERRRDRRASLLVVHLRMTGRLLVNGAPDETTRRSVSFTRLGDSLFAEWAVPFEVASLVLLVALIGAIVIAREREEEEE